jgi:tRNA(fMet)-specific endonuclease VapC
LNTNEDTATVYGIIKASLRKKGKPILENDIWIATLAKQYELILITRDKHFNEIDGLSIENW